MINLGNQDHKIYQGDCLEVMQELINKGIKVDCIITDIPYGMTHNSWDSIIPLDKMWELLNQIKKEPTTPILLFADDPFSAYLQISNQKHYRYKWFWNKEIATGFLDSAWKPLKVIEQVLVFIEKPFEQVKSQQVWKKKDRVAQFFPQYSWGGQNHSKGTKLTQNSGTTYSSFKNLSDEEIASYKISQTHETTFYREGLKRVGREQALKHPKNLITFKKEKPNKFTKNHPTAKPVELLEYLVKTYTKEGQVILDFTAGGGSLLQASLNTNRKSINIELEPNYVEMIKDRLNEKQQKFKLFR